MVLVQDPTMGPTNKNPSLRIPSAIILTDTDRWQLPENANGPRAFHSHKETCMMWVVTFVFKLAMFFLYIRLQY
jgi:hypothetical protein